MVMKNAETFFLRISIDFVNFYYYFGFSVKKSRIRLLNYPIGVSGYQETASEQETLQQSFNRVFHQQMMLQYSNNEDVESLIEMS